MFRILQAIEHVLRTPTEEELLTVTWPAGEVNGPRQPSEVRRTRVDLGLTQRQLDQLGVGRATVGHWERGTRGVPEPVARLLQEPRDPTPPARGGIPQTASDPALRAQLHQRRRARGNGRRNGLRPEGGIA